MKNILVFIFSIALLINMNLAKGQTDTLKPQNQLDSISEIEPGQIGKRKYLDANFRVEKNLIKFGISPVNISNNKGKLAIPEISSTISIERKIIPNLSIIASHNSIYSYYYNSHFQFTDDIGLRYYYSIKKRMRQSIGSNNFHSNYFSAKVDVAAYSFYEYNNRFTPSDLSVNISWGIQRRISNWGLVDLGPYIKLSSSSFVGFNFLFGLGWGF